MGFFFAYILSSYKRLKTEKIDEISRKFAGLNVEYEQVQERMQSTVKWRYRVKFIEKIYYIALLALGFLVYKSPSLLQAFLFDHPIFTVSFFSLTIVGFSFSGFYLDQRSRKNEQLAKKLKE